MSMGDIAVPFPAQPIIAHFAEKLSIPLHSPEGTDRQHASSIDREQGTCASLWVSWSL